MEDGRGVDGAHDRELLELAGLAVGVGAHVEEHGAAGLVGHHRGQGRAVHLLQRAQHQLGHGPAGGGVAGGEEGVGRAVAHPLDRHQDGRALLERGAGDGLPHPDGLGRVDDVDAEAFAAGLLQLGGHHLARADQGRMQAEVAAGRHRPFHDDVRAVVAAEGVDRHPGRAGRTAAGLGQTSSTFMTCLPL